MLPISARFTPTAAELATVRTALLKGRPRPSLPLTITLSALFLIQGVLRVAYPTGQANHDWYGYVQIVLGIVYAPLTWAGRRVHLSFTKANREIDLTIDDAGITLGEPAKSIPWRSIKTVLDVGEAFVFERSWDRRIAILKRAMPDGGRELWATLDAKLTSTRYLVRGTDSDRRINNGLERS